MRIALLITTLNGGGAERVMSSMANHWAAKGHEVTLITHDRTENDFFPLERTVIRYGFDISKPPRHIGDTIRHNIQRISLPRSVMKEIHPDVAISFTVRMNIQNLIALTGTGIPIIVSERNNPLAQRQPLPWELLRKHLYPRSSALVVQTDAARAWASAFMPQHKIHVIPNPVSVQGSTSPGTHPVHPDRPVVCSIGRLIPSKGFDILVRSFHAASRDKPEWTLQILGEGQDRPRLERIAGELGIQDRVLMPGRVKNPFDYLRSSTLFVLPSRHEGFPNALIEAMTLGLPVISTDCPFGPSEIITHGVDGILVPNGDMERLSHEMRCLMENAGSRESLGQNAKASSRRFHLDVIMQRWESLVHLVLAACGVRRGQ